MASSADTTSQPSTSLWKLGGLTVWQFTSNVLHGINEDDLFGHASELAFSFLLALFPILLLILALFGLFASRSSQLHSSLLFHFSHFLPAAEFEPLSRITIGLARNATRGKLTFGMVLALWFGSVGVSSMMSTLNAAYRVRESRSWLRIRLIALGLTVAISILLLIALLLLIVSGNVPRRERRPRR